MKQNINIQMPGKQTPNNNKYITYNQHSNIPKLNTFFTLFFVRSEKKENKYKFSNQ